MQTAQQCARRDRRNMAPPTQCRPMSPRRLVSATISLDALTKRVRRIRWYRTIGSERARCGGAHPPCGAAAWAAHGERASPRGVCTGGVCSVCAGGGSPRMRRERTSPGQAREGYGPHRMHARDSAPHVGPTSREASSPHAKLLGRRDGGAGVQGAGGLCGERRISRRVAEAVTRSPRHERSSRCGRAATSVLMCAATSAVATHVHVHVR